MDEPKPLQLPTDPPVSETIASDREGLPLTPEQQARMEEEYQKLRAFWDELYAYTPRIYCTYIFIAVNVLAYLAMVASGVDYWSPTGNALLAWGANYGPYTIGRGEWWRIATSTVLHFGLVHIACNMLALLDFGRLIERFYGNLAMAVIYILAGFGGSLASLYWNPLPVSAGASGAIFGLIGAMVAIYLRGRSWMPVLILDSIKRTLLNVAIYVGIFALYMPNVDHAAHAGGGITGLLVGLVLAGNPAVDRRRWIRSLAMVAAAMGACVIAYQALPPVDDVQGAINRVITLDTGSAKQFEAMFADHQAQKLDRLELADRLEREVVRPWQKLHEDLSGFKHVPRAKAALVGKLTEYAQLRAEAWELQVQAIRDNTPALPERSRVVNEQANVLVAEIEALLAK